DFVEEVLIHVFDGGPTRHPGEVSSDTGVIDKHVDLPEVSIDFGGHLADRVLVGDVRCDAQGLSVQLMDLRDCRIEWPPIDGGHAGAFLCEAASDLASDATGAAGNDDDLTGTSHERALTR